MASRYVEQNPKRFFVLFANLYILNSVLVEHGTVPGEDWVQANFIEKFTNRRYESVEFQEFLPVTSIAEARKIDFFLPRFSGPHMYLCHDLYVKVDIVLSKKDGSIPSAAADVAPANNVLHSLFSECKVYLEDQIVNDSNENYAYKAFIIDLLSFDSNAKYTFLQGQGFYQDAPSHMDSSAGNAAFTLRKKLFRNSSNTAYTSDVVTLVGKLHTDLRSCPAGIVPGVAIRIEVTRSPDDFVLIRPIKNPPQTDDYKITLKGICLLCPVATLSTDTFRKLEKQLSSNPANLYYTRVQVTNRAIPAHSKTFVSENLFPGTQLPCKLILGFIPTTTFLGDINRNPYNFARTWTWTTSSGVDMAGPSTSLGGGSEVEGVTLTKTVFLERVSLSLNGKSVDGWESRATATNDTMMFMRLHHYLGFTKSRTGNNLTLGEFMGGAYFCTYDLSTSGQSAIDPVIPSVRLGNLRLKLEFSASTVEELTLIMYAEFPSLMQIDKFRRIKTSFL